MSLSVAFVAALVVAGQPRHQFLLIPVTGIGHELVGRDDRAASWRRDRDAR